MLWHERFQARFSRIFALVIPAALALGLTVSDTRAQEKPPINWLIWDLPPEFIKSGPFKNQGYADQFLQFFIDNLPGYRHTIRHVNVPRWSLDVLKPNRCSAHLWGGFFPGKLILSKPYTFTPPHVVIFHQRHQSRIGPKGTLVSLEALLKHSDLTLAIMRLNFNENADQSRYPVLSRYLAPYVGKANLKEFSSPENVVNLRLLALGRADYTIGYPSTITTQMRVKNLANDYVAYRIKEHNLYKKVYVACNNDAFGREIIEQINRLLTKDVLLQFLAYHEEWNDHDPAFRETTVEYFIEGKNLNRVID